MVIPAFSFTWDNYSLREKCPYLELFFSAFSRIRTEYGEKYSVCLCIQSECGKMWIKITPNTDTFYAVIKEPASKIQLSRREATMRIDAKRKLATWLCYDPSPGGSVSIVQNLYTYVKFIF